MSLGKIVATDSLKKDLKHSVKVIVSKRKQRGKNAGLQRMSY
jgi:hypothetical protein